MRGNSPLARYPQIHQRQPARRATVEIGAQAIRPARLQRDGIGLIHDEWRHEPGAQAGDPGPFHDGLDRRNQQDTRHHRRGQAQSRRHIHGAVDRIGVARQVQIRLRLRLRNRQTRRLARIRQGCWIAELRGFERAEVLKDVWKLLDETRDTLVVAETARRAVVYVREWGEEKEDRRGHAVSLVETLKKRASIVEGHVDRKLCSKRESGLAWLAVVPPWTQPSNPHRRDQ